MSSPHSDNNGSNNNQHDISDNYYNNSSNNIGDNGHDNSNNHNKDNSGNSIPSIDISMNVPSIVNYTLNQINTESGFIITHEEGTTFDGSFVIHTTFTTTDPSLCAIDISENLVEIVTEYDDEVDPNSQTSILLQQIKAYAGEIKCESFHGKGTIDDYTELFNAASKIAIDSKQIQLDIDVDGFTDFGKAADDLSKLFSSFIIKLQNVNIINDVVFLTAISNALAKIVNLSKVFAHFKETILFSMTRRIPRSTHDTALILRDVMDEINCAMQYINYYVDSTNPAPDGADLTNIEKHIIDKAVMTIENWNTICDEGVTIAMSKNPDVQYIKQTSNSLIQTTSLLKTATAKLYTKLTIQT